MQAYQLKELNQNLQVEEIDLILGEGEVRTKTLYAGLNRRDHWIVKGLYPGISLPAVLGSDAVVMFEDEKYIVNPNEDWGINPSVPSKEYTIRGLQHQGTFATESAVRRSKLFRKPKHLTDEQAAILPLGGLTAYRALISNCRLQQEDRVLINGVGGGVAMLAFQMAISMGAEVYVTSSSEEKLEKAISLGAKGGAIYKKENWGKDLKKSSGGFDVIIDSAGGSGFVQLIHASNMGARIGVYGGTRGNIEGLSPQHLFFKQIHILGSTMGNDQEFAEMINFVDTYKMQPVVDSVYDFDHINEAMKAMLSREKFGKIAVRVTSI